MECSFKAETGCGSMSVHHWSNVDANLFHDFHQTWTINIRNALNRGVLPPGYSALVEQHAGGVEPDVVALESRQPNRRPSRDNRGGGTLMAAPPPAEWQRIQSSNPELSLARRANRIAIRHSLGRVVCILEIVSPGNKSSKSALAQFIRKTVEFLDGGVHVLVVDLFSPSARDPQGIHGAIWDEIGGQPFELPFGKPMTLASYVAGDVKTAYVRPIGYSDVLPDMPAWLDEESYVPVPLESTYRETWDSCPEDMREVIEHGPPAAEDQTENREAKP
jgi:hypothetical protein